MIDEATLTTLLDQLERAEGDRDSAQGERDATAKRCEILIDENARLKLRIDFLLRERMDPKSLEMEGRKPLSEKVLREWDEGQPEDGE